jgi:hypothetical protein
MSWTRSGKTWSCYRCRPRRGLAEAYLERLAAAGALRAERRTRLGIFPVTRWHVADAARQAEATQAAIDAATSAATSAAVAAATEAAHSAAHGAHGGGGGHGH